MSRRRGLQARRSRTRVTLPDESVTGARLYLRIASRTSHWQQSLKDALSGWWDPDNVMTLVLAPLTGRDIWAAADTELYDPDAFVAAVRSTGVGALAARPITLKLLLRAFKEGDLPHSRQDIYREGTAALAAEPGVRRQDRRRDDPPVSHRLHAARQLAVVSMLSGSPHMVRRVHPGLTANVVGGDTVAGNGIDSDHLDAVLDSALMSSVSSGAGILKWTHRTVEEYLCAERLAELPLKTIVNLLGDPIDGQRVTPQLADMAGWIAGLRDDVFSWLVDRQPDLLLNPDLTARTEVQRRFLVGALFDAFYRGDAPLEPRDYRGLQYEGFASDLAPLLAEGQPTWVRREALLIVQANGLRVLDDQLVALVEEVFTSEQPNGYTERVRLASLAILALEDCQSPDLISRLRALVRKHDAPSLLRADLVELLWPTSLSTAELIDAIPPNTVAYGPSGLGPQIIRIISRRLAAGGDLYLGELAGWLADQPPQAHHDQHFQSVAGAAFRQIIANTDIGSPPWRSAAALLMGQIRQTVRPFGWGEEELTGLENRRRRLVRDALRGRADPIDIRRLILFKLIRADDLSWWLDELGSNLDDEAAVVTALGVAENLAQVIPDEEVGTAFHAAIANYPSLRELIEGALGDEARAHRAAARRECCARRD